MRFAAMKNATNFSDTKKLHQTSYRLMAPVRHQGFFDKVCDFAKLLILLEPTAGIEPATY